mmetsp:Transcript_27445/g.54896  ORF Transcript_27445/g.54896 Transcript_27445/m.54896 type:complete len:201 (+) Transcript_27445:36-638(+)
MIINFTLNEACIVDQPLHGHHGGHAGGSYRLHIKPHGDAAASSTLPRIVQINPADDSDMRPPAIHPPVECDRILEAPDVPPRPWHRLGDNAHSSAGPHSVRPRQIGYGDESKVSFAKRQKTLRKLPGKCHIDPVVGVATDYDYALVKRIHFWHGPVPVIEGEEIPHLCCFVSAGGGGAQEGLQRGSSVIRRFKKRDRGGD